LSGADLLLDWWWIDCFPGGRLVACLVVDWLLAWWFDWLLVCWWIVFLPGGGLVAYLVVDWLLIW